ncbi:TPA: NAD(P)H-binding protein [Streptococcus suis]|uniref:NAD(P)H-binding protein n=1 Tax=Streptococcus suis TaxID=1307 RepID=UPI00209AEED5|nr:NAD(P)H-binding protein [Streptococcus suis]MCO8174363.1 NAD(P)H-binding protein [Streptococcus suis]MCO8208763.1 NAD(P)H-binding protein [Streptococcus suis]HEM3488816.1 NAD(P)H-binding protein [Streptococcus suis]HEM3506792.1 NAD(P)H-binding protein [Streptococcus suis]
MKKVLILGAAGQIAGMVTDYLLDQTDYELVLYARQASSRLAHLASERISLVDGNFNDKSQLLKALDGVDAVYLNYVSGPDVLQTALDAIQESGVKRLIAVSVPDIYQEITGPFQKWYRENTGIMWTSPVRDFANLVEASDLDYVLLRITWLYNKGLVPLKVTRKGEPFTSAQVSRQSVAQFVVDLLTGKEDYHRESLGLGEVGTDFVKPSFY